MSRQAEADTPHHTRAIQAVYFNPDVWPKPRAMQSCGERWRTTSRPCGLPSSDASTSSPSNVPQNDQCSQQECFQRSKCHSPTGGSRVVRRGGPTRPGTDATHPSGPTMPSGSGERPLGTPLPRTMRAPASNICWFGLPSSAPSEAGLAPESRATPEVRRGVIPTTDRFRSKRTPIL